jgi:hypothetical protein
VDGTWDFTVECTSPCTTGTLVNIPTGYTLINRGGYIFDSSGLLTNTVAGGINHYLNNQSLSGVENFILQSQSTGRYLLALSAIAADKQVTMPALAANDTWAFLNAMQTFQSKTLNATSSPGDAVLFTAAGGHPYHFNVTNPSAPRTWSISDTLMTLWGSLALGATGTIQNAAGTGTMGLTLKKGSGAGNYTNATTSYTVADSSNLCYTVTIPTGWKLGVSASGGLSTATAAVVAQAALTDNAACSTANAGILVESPPIQGSAIGVADTFALNWVITGDGASHNIALQFKTSNAADTASLINSSATITPTMKFELMPSN